jgi:hypothetical protein
MFATNNNLNQYAEDVFKHGITDWSDELADAESDIVNLVKAKYWNKMRSGIFDKDLLTQSQWTKATVFRALTMYILPKLSTFRVEDVFMEQIHFYKERFSEEMDIQFAVGIEYDANEDDTVQESEKHEFVQDRLYR